ncbi:MAG TPA: extracellular solute-binding protein, partial [Limnochordia bacterium]|nr:extracellular solute-binding protein [Limnochordia bacterium]
MSDLTRRANRGTSDRLYHHRRALAPLLSLVAIVGVSGAAGAEQTLTVGVVHYSGEALNYFQNTIVHEFEQQHPGVKVVLQTGTWATWKEKLQTWYAANTLPDAFQIGSQDLGGLAPFGMLLPIDQYAKGWAELSDFPPVELQDGTYEGKLYDIPYALNLRTLAYRKDLFAQVGLDPNRPPDNWDELAGFAQKLTKRDAAGNITQAGFNA